MTGSVTFVSSGPGDPELLTVKAVNALSAADVILFDDLSSGPILSHAAKTAELIAVGKRAGQASVKQDHVSRLLVDYAKTAERVVRLKSGDAGIFGRLEEEITSLRAAGIPFEVIPGVTAASAAAAAASIPLTRRLAARRLQFITGHDVSGALPQDLNLTALADPAATTVVYMGRRTFARLAEMLMGAGLAPDTPALLAEAVSTPQQRLDYTTVHALSQMPADVSSKAPALVLYGPLATRDE